MLQVNVLLSPLSVLWSVILSIVILLKHRTKSHFRLIENVCSCHPSLLEVQFSWWRVGPLPKLSRWNSVLSKSFHETKKKKKKIFQLYWQPCHSNIVISTYNLYKYWSLLHWCQQWCHIHRYLDHYTTIQRGTTSRDGGPEVVNGPMNVWSV